VTDWEMLGRGSEIGDRQWIKGAERIIERENNRL
jgi:hypothetical protein